MNNNTPSTSPAVTVFMSCYQHGSFLPDAIDSVLRQTMDNFELLLYDDASTDDSWGIMQRYASQDSRIHVSWTPHHQGVGRLVNQSVAQARGHNWVWCPADDMLSPDCLQVKLSHSRRLQHRYVIYSRGELVGESGEHIESSCPPPMNDVQFAARIWHQCPIGFTGIWIPLEYLRQEPFPEDMAFSEDYFWILKATGRGFPFFGAKQTLYKKRLHANRTTFRHAGGIRDDIAAIRQRAKQELGWT